VTTQPPNTTPKVGIHSGGGDLDNIMYSSIFVKLFTVDLLNTEEEEATKRGFVLDPGGRLS
jgi:hypothetical protein